MSVNTSRSGFQVVTVPVFFGGQASFSSFETGSPLRKCMEYFVPPVYAVTSINSEAHCVAQAPSPLVPSEYSYTAEAELLYFPPAYSSQ